MTMKGFIDLYLNTFCGRVNERLHSLSLSVFKRYMKIIRSAEKFPKSTGSYKLIFPLCLHYENTLQGNQVLDLDITQHEVPKSYWLHIHFY